MKISAPLLIPIARQDVSRAIRPAVPMEVEKASSPSSLSSLNPLNPVRDEVQLYKPNSPLSEGLSGRDNGHEKSKAVDVYKMTAAIDAGKGDGDLIGVDVFA